MTLEEFKALPAGTVVKIENDEDVMGWDYGKIVSVTAIETTIMWEDRALKMFVGYTPGWTTFIEWLEVA